MLFLKLTLKNKSIFNNEHAGAGIVDVFIPLEPINPEEIHLDELMDDIVNDERLQEEHIQLGFVELMEPEVHPIFSQMPDHVFLQPKPPKPNAEAIRLWANLFSSRDALTSVYIPHEWSDFFTALLANPTCFAWAKNFLQSPAWNLMGDNSVGNKFFLPNRFSAMQSAACNKDLYLDAKAILTVLQGSAELGSPPHLANDKGKVVVEDSSPGTPIEQISHKVSPSTGPWSKIFLDQAKQVKKAYVLDDPHQRRSKRVQNLINGFKGPQCSSKNYLGCTVVPPNLSPSIIWNLGATFCKLDDKDLTEPALQKKKKVAVPAPGGKKAPKKKPMTEYKNADGSKKDNKKQRK
jgi:hypothetical protein